MPKNVRVMIVSQKFADQADQTEKWYGTKYSIGKVPYELDIT